MTSGEIFIEVMRRHFCNKPLSLRVCQFLPLHHRGSFYGSFQRSRYQQKQFNDVWLRSRRRIKADPAVLDLGSENLTFYEGLVDYPDSWNPPRHQFVLERQKQKNQNSHRLKFRWFFKAVCIFKECKKKLFLNSLKFLGNVFSRFQKLRFQNRPINNTRWYALWSTRADPEVLVYSYSKKISENFDFPTQIFDFKTLCCKNWHLHRTYLNQAVKKSNLDLIFGIFDVRVVLCFVMEVFRRTC